MAAAAALGLCLVSAPAAQANGNCVTYWGPRGAGTLADPYPVASVLDLDEVRFCLSAYFRQTANIALTGTWVPLGSAVQAFTGNYNGAGYAITELSTTDTTANYIGLFGIASGATLTDIHVSGSLAGGTYVGGLVGFMTSTTISGVTSAVSVTSTGGYVGGLVGYQGSGAGTITNSSATGNVTGGSNSTNVGGLVGYLLSGAVTDSTATGNVAGGSNSRYAGGLIGFLDAGTITNSSATGNVTGGSNSMYAGGLIGYVWGVNGAATIQRSFATGNTVGGSYVGGLVGQLSAVSHASTINDAFARGSVTVSGTWYGGSLIGSEWSTTAGRDFRNRVYGTGQVIGTALYLGGFLGDTAGSSWATSYWDTATTGKSTATSSGAISGVTGSTTAALTSIDTFSTAGWSISDTWVASGTTWGICESINDGYPYLMSAYESDPCPPTPSDSSGQSTPTGPAPTYTVSLDANGGRCTTTSLRGPATSWVTLPAADACEFVGYELIGWNTSMNGSGSQLAPGAGTALAGDNTMFAMWRANSPVASTTAAPTPTLSITGRQRLPRWPSRYVVQGTSTGLEPGTVLTVHTRKRGQVAYVDAGTVPISADGTFTWTGISARLVRAYVSTTDDSGESTLRSGVAIYRMRRG